MSTLVSKNVQIGADGTASNNFTLYQPAAPDGTLRLGNGNSGITSSLLTLTSAGSLGIGTTTPDGGLDVEKQNSYFGDTTNGGRLFFRRGVDGSAVGRTGWISGSNVNFEIANDSGSGNLILQTNSASRVEINSTGDTNIKTGNLVIGTSGKGIDFSAAGGDVLTTYDEGTWSPTISSTSGTITTASSSSAFYTRVGSMVSFTVVLTITDNGSGAGQLRFTLPFSGTRGYANAIGVNASSGVTVQGTSSSASPSSIDMNKVDGTYPVTSGQSLRISGTYIV